MGEDPEEEPQKTQIVLVFLSSDALLPLIVVVLKKRDQDDGIKMMKLR